MRLVELEVAGAYRVELQPIRDERGSFARSYCAEVFAAHALAPSFVQANISDNDRRGTLRGLHYQAAPHAEAKLIRCVRGAAWVAVLDLRRSSPSFARWSGLELEPDAGTAVYVPPGCASGFVTLRDATQLHYLMSAAYAPASARGVRWNDPAFAVDWPVSPAVISAKDAGLPDYPRSPPAMEVRP